MPQQQLDLLKKPSTNGRATKSQVKGDTFSIISSTSLQNPGFGSPPTPDYNLFEIMLKNPTVQLGLAFAGAPIRTASWNITEKKNAPAGAKEFIEEQILPLKDWFLHHALQALAYGNKAFEKVFDIDKDGKIVISKFVPLNHFRTKVLINNNTGAFAGLLADDGKTPLSPEKVFLFTHDIQNNDFYGRSRFLNFIDDWNAAEALREKQGRHAERIASAIPIISYPEGTSKNAQGQDVDNFDIAKKMLENVAQGIGIVKPSTLTPVEMAAVVKGADPSKLGWQIDIKESSSGHGSDFVLQRKHQEALILRGLLVPERALTESQGGGSRADSESHGSIAVSVADWTLKEIVRHVNWYWVNQLIALNFGVDAVGTIELQPEPLSDPKKHLMNEVIRMLFAPQNADLTTTILDLPKMLEMLGLPQQDFDMEELKPEPEIIQIPQDNENSRDNESSNDRENEADGQPAEPRVR